MKNPLVSVVIPTYNRVDYLQQAIDSVLSQAYSPLEILVIDDGSTDGTREVVQGKYKEKIHYVWQENKDRSAARNRGMELANGKYVAFLDSDDLWRPEKLARQVQIMEHPGFEGVVAVCSSVWRVDARGKRFDPAPIGRVTKLSRFELADFFTGPKIFASPSNMLFRADLLRQVGGFDPSIRFGEDWDLIIRLRAKGQFHYIDQPLLEYRVHSSGTQEISTAENIPRYLEDRLKVIHKNAPLLNGAEYLLKRVEAQLYDETAYRYFAADSIQQGFDYLYRAGTLQKSFFSPLSISQKIGSWVVAGALERLKSFEAVDEYFINQFLPKLVEQWPLYLNSRPNEKQLLGWFYHNLALLIGSTNTEYRKRMLKKSIKFQPMLIFTRGTLRNLLA